MEKGVNGYYTRMLRTTLNVHWQQHMKNRELYGSFSRVRETFRARRLRLAGHCARHNEETASKVLLGNPNMVTRNEVDIELHTLTLSRLILDWTIPKR